MTNNMMAIPFAISTQLRCFLGVFKSLLFTIVIFLYNFAVSFISGYFCLNQFSAN